jgi:predicted metal-dependent phosphoesterase TrpH
VGAYRIPEGGLSVHYEINFSPRQPRWLVGDLHMHSTASDGKHEIFTLAKMAQKEGLDFIAVSNHNNYSENLNLPVVPGLTFIPAVEWTHYRGHMNFYGVANPFDNSFVANSELEMQSLIANAKAKGALISVNHPKDNLCPYLWQSEDSFDLVEVWNGPMRKANIDGIGWWQNMLRNGRKIPLVGGSDFHRSGHIVRFAHPVTHVYASSPAVDDILNAISHGRSYVSASVKCVQLDLHCGEHMMGDTVQKQDCQTLKVTASRLRPGMHLKLVTQDGVAAEWRRFNHGNIEAEVPVAASWRFAYLLVYRPLFGMEYVRAISNPIYFNEE